MLNNISADNAKTALCVGKIAEMRRLRFVKDIVKQEEFLSNVHRYLAYLIAEGYDTFLFTSWGYFDYLLCKCLQSMNEELPEKQRLFIMAVFKDDEYDTDLPDTDGFFEFIINQKEEGISLSDEDRISRLLGNAGAVLYDSEDMDSYVEGFVQLAQKKNIRLINLSKLIQQRYR